MRPSKLFSIVAVFLAVTVATSASNALVKKPPAKKAGKVAAQTKITGKTTPDQKSRHGKDKRGKRGKKRAPYILAPKTADIITPSAPHPHHFSPEFSDALARGDLTRAYHDLQLEEASDKVGYMINQVMMARGKTISHREKPSVFDRATAYHNLYLFLARQGRPAPKFLKEAIRYYQKAGHKPEYADRAAVLTAAIDATAGDRDKSQKYFSKVNIEVLTQGGKDYNGLEYLATYYAATHQTTLAIATLEQAYKLNPGPLLLWLHVGDDFWAIEDDAAFKDQRAKWVARHHQQLAQLQRDKMGHDARKKAALELRHKKKHGKSGKKK